MSDVNKYQEMSNDMKFCQILVKMEERWEVIIPLYIGLLCSFQHFFYFSPLYKEVIFSPNAILVFKILFFELVKNGIRRTVEVGIELIQDHIALLFNLVDREGRVERDVGNQLYRTSEVILTSIGQVHWGLRLQGLGIHSSARGAVMLAGKEGQAVETAAFVVAQRVTPSSPGGNHWLWAAVHTPEDPLSHWACFQ